MGVGWVGGCGLVYKVGCVKPREYFVESDCFDGERVVIFSDVASSSGEDFKEFAIRVDGFYRPARCTSIV